MWFYLKQCRWWHVAQELSAVTLVCCLCFTTVHACATFFIHLFSWFHFVCACLFHCALHTVWTEVRFTLVTTAVFTWEQNKKKNNKTYWLLKVSVNCVLMCVNSLLHLHLQATCDKLAWLLCHDYYPYTYTLILPVLFSIMNAWSTSPFRVEFIKEPLLEEFKNMPIGDTGKGI